VTKVQSAESIAHSAETKKTLTGLPRLPKGWEFVSINDIADVIMGQSPPSITYNDHGIGLPFFQGKTEFTDLHPIAEKWCSKPNKTAIQNDILLSVRAPVGATNIADRECCIGRGLAAVRYRHNHKFIYYYLRLIAKELDKKGTGTTFRAISGDVIKETKFFLPPLNEQHRIVAKIEELFSSLDKGIESLKTAQQQLKIYRQAVLKWAFEGKLTNEDAKEDELPAGWKRVKLGTVIEQPRYGTSKKCNYDFRGKGVLRIPNISNGIIDASDLKFAEFNNDEVETYKLKEGDLLTIRSNGSVELVGKCSRITKKDEDYLFAGYLIRLRPLKENALSKYLLHVLSSSELRLQIETKAKSTSGVNNINSDELKSLVIPLCCISEQHAIVAEIESRLSVCDKIEESIEQSLKQAESLRQSILKRAFEGKLVPQDPNDEPASVLLARIKAEQEKNKTDTVKLRPRKTSKENDFEVNH